MLHKIIRLNIIEVIKSVKQHTNFSHVSIRMVIYPSSSSSLLPITNQTFLTLKSDMITIYKRKLVLR